MTDVRTQPHVTYARDINVTLEIVALNCSDCDMTFGIGAEFMRKRRDDHRTFYCPNGHSQYYPQKSKAEKMQAELDAARSLASREAQRRRVAENDKKTAELQRNAYKGHATRLKKRVAAGKCPCCSEQFPDVAAHIAEQHPGYADPAGGSVGAGEDGTVTP